MHFVSRDESFAASNPCGSYFIYLFSCLLCSLQSWPAVPVSLTGSVFKYCWAYLAGRTSLDSLWGRDESARGSPSKFFIVLRLNCNHLSQCEWHESSPAWLKVLIFWQLGLCRRIRHAESQLSLKTKGKKKERHLLMCLNHLINNQLEWGQRELGPRASCCLLWVSHHGEESAGWFWSGGQRPQWKPQTAATFRFTSSAPSTHTPPPSTVVQDRQDPRHLQGWPTAKCSWNQISLLQRPVGSSVNLLIFR